MAKGDCVLASGGVRAQFAPAGSSKTQKEWDAMWKDYVPEKTFIKAETKEEIYFLISSHVSTEGLYSPPLCHVWNAPCLL